MENDLISRSVLLSGWNRTMLDGIARDIIMRQPAVDAAPVVHSRFVNMGGFPVCEHCGASPGTHEPKPDNPSGFPPYCYACGSKMDKEEP